jgi:hypothetical protein
MDWTDVHYRQLARLISRRTWLWTEMVVDKTVLHAQQLDRFLWFPPEQHPIVLQLGGSDPQTLAAAAVKARCRRGRGGGRARRGGGGGGGAPAGGLCFAVQPCSCGPVGGRARPC